MSNFRKVFLIFLSVLPISGLAAGVWIALRSELFELKAIEVALDGSLDRGAPHWVALEEELLKKAQKVVRVHADGVRGSNLFHVPLGELERALREVPWVRELAIQKSFPQSIKILAAIRAPRALFHHENGSLSYVDDRGQLIQAVDLSVPSDLPVISSRNGSATHRQLLDVIDALAGLAGRVESVQHDPASGYKALIAFAHGKASLWLGSEPNATLTAERIRQLNDVLAYAGQKHIPLRQVRADLGKKIVVKTARGS